MIDFVLREFGVLVVCEIILPYSEGQGLSAAILMVRKTSKEIRHYRSRSTYSTKALYSSC